MSSFNESLNDLNSTRIPYFSRSQVEDLFDKFQNDDHFVLDPNVVGDIWLRSGGHPATVCLCGQFIRDRLPVLLDDQTRHVSFTAWKRCTVEELYQWIGLNPAYKRMLQAFPSENPDSEGSRSILFLSYRFFGSLDPVRILPDELYFSESLMAKGVLTGTQPNYRIASAFVDSFVRKTLLTARFPKRPDDAPPVIDGKIDALDAIKKATRRFDWGLLYHSDGAPLRQGLYDTELARILMNWMNTSEGWSATSDWHSGTIGMHSYIIIKKGTPPAEHTIVIAVLATRDAAFAHLRLLGLIEYKELMGADEAWLVQYSREDDFRKIWRSYDPLEKGVNVIYFQHGVYFPRNKMSARWKDAQGQTHKILKEASKVSVIPESRL
ncbi:uncharacterized protein EV420DRAFT_1103486 [Desarmillaria tabescens]|uniref:Uncharacterized protein n=1 Tax=Armillaria tabescens TaxID=1929756 RepID=A0AA39T4D3_ARMTA|nr:uncharacterized protein EV420DRAFT_1103486 [Desarmillaria tabescens]KAK0463691.1 hypothetical protein EV420DRAFT_1103486 [Desarmillaria tabescens]